MSRCSVMIQATILKFKPCGLNAVRSVTSLPRWNTTECFLYRLRLAIVATHCRLSNNTIIVAKGPSPRRGTACDVKNADSRARTSGLCPCKPRGHMQKRSLLALNQHPACIAKYEICQTYRRWWFSHLLSQRPCGHNGLGEAVHQPAQPHLHLTHLPAVIHQLLLPIAGCTSALDAVTPALPRPPSSLVARNHKRLRAKSLLHAADMMFSSRRIPLSTLLLSLSAWTGSVVAGDTITAGKIKVQLFAAPSFLSEVSVDAYNNQCLSLDNNL
jgi:hypothetical protein